MKKITESKVFSIICKVALFIIKRTNLLKETEPDRYECINCKNVFDKIQECKCGGNRFIFNSRKYKIKRFEIICECGTKNWENVVHYDCDDGFIEEYICSRCKNIISIYEYMEYEEVL